MWGFKSNLRRNARKIHIKTKMYSIFIFRQAKWDASGTKEDDKKISNNVIIGIYDKSLTQRGEYRALVGIELI